MSRDLTIRERLVLIEDKLDTHINSHKWMVRLIITLVAAEALRQIAPSAYKLIEHATALSNVLPPLTGGG
jgi:hypothetical protein